MVQGRGATIESKRCFSEIRVILIITCSILLSLFGCQGGTPAGVLPTGASQSSERTAPESRPADEAVAGSTSRRASPEAVTGDGPLREPPSGPGWLKMSSWDGTYVLSFQFFEEIPFNEEIVVEGVVFRDGRPLPDSAIVHFDGGMPHHGHGLAVPVETTRLPHGGFRAEGVRFHMTGRWLLTVDVQEGPYLERAHAWVRIR